MAESARVADASMDAAVEILAPGRSEYEVAAVAEACGKKTGRRVCPHGHRARRSGADRPARRPEDRKRRDGRLGVWPSRWRGTGRRWRAPSIREFPPPSSARCTKWPIVASRLASRRLVPATAWQTWQRPSWQCWNRQVGCNGGNTTWAMGWSGPSGSAFRYARFHDAD